MEILSDIKHILHLIIMFQCILFSIYLFTQKERRKSNRLFALFLLAVALSSLDGLYAYFPELRMLVYRHIPHLFHIGFPFHYAYTPLLFLYILSMIRPDFKLKSKHLLHFIPFLFFCIIIITKFHIHSVRTLQAILAADEAFTLVPVQLYNHIEDAQFFLYAVVSLILLRRYRVGIKNNYSTIHRINLSWLRFVLLGFIVWRVLGIIETILWALTQNTCLIVVYMTGQVVFLVFVSLMVLKALKQPEIFTGNSGPFGRMKYEKTRLSSSQLETYTKRLKAYMAREKPFLNPALTIGDLSERTEIPQHHLSQVINSCFNQNFFDFINVYRIEESKKRLADEKAYKRTVLEILYETGFSSKSVFNKAFKKHTGMTPTEFRKRQNA